MPYEEIKPLLIVRITFFFQKITEKLRKYLFNITSQKKERKLKYNVTKFSTFFNFRYYANFISFNHRLCISKMFFIENYFYVRSKITRNKLLSKKRRSQHILKTLLFIVSF